MTVDERAGTAETVKALYNNKGPNTLYHYCSTETFFNIIKHKSFRMSSLVMSNDSMEGRWAVEVINNACTKIFQGQLHFVINDEISHIPEVLSSVGLCLSEEGDLLSQWRGYASNGAGICIGIGRKALLELTKNKINNGEETFLQKVIYRQNEQQKLIIEEINRHNDILNDRDINLITGYRLGFVDNNCPKEKLKQLKYKEKRFLAALTALSPYFFAFKSPAFAEEKEWRVMRGVINHGYKGYDFHPSERKIVPFDTLEFKENSSGFINEVVLGPRHETPKEVIAAFLEENGLKGVRVRKSSATYR